MGWGRPCGCSRIGFGACPAAYTHRARIENGVEPMSQEPRAFWIGGDTSSRE